MHAIEDMRRTMRDVRDLKTHGEPS
jgi:hypothetical protein